MAATRPPLYREVLTPALHRRFTGSALLVFGFCYIEGIVIAEKTSLLWTWFPLGPAGLRASLLFISALSIFVLRVASLHLGNRASSSPATSFTINALSLNTCQTFAFYLFSAWWFSEVYIWSASSSPNLGWVVRGKPYERNRLNERTIYFRSFFVIFALTQSIIHLFYDYDKVPLPIRSSRESLAPQRSGGLQAWFLSRVDTLTPMFTWDPQDWKRSIPQNIALRTLAVGLTTPFVYQILIRRKTWEISLSIASLLWDVPPLPLSFIPPNYPSLVRYTITAGLQLLFLWQASNALFTEYVATQPIKKDQPLSSDSKDPTGTLLNGLKSRKEVPKTFACWELSLITSNFADRRKTVFTDIDRPSGSAWLQVSTYCLRNINSINNSINTFLSPPPSLPSNTQATTNIESLPRISTPLRQGNIFARPATPSTNIEKVEENIGNLAKSYGQSPAPGTLKIPTLSPETRSRISSSGKNILSPKIQRLLTEGKENLSPNGVQGKFYDYILRFLRSQPGQPFRQTFSRRVTSVVLGTPYSTLYSTVTSIKSLAALAVASLDEDPYGRVSKDVPTLIRTYTQTIQNIEAFIQNLQPHWTDVYFKEEDRIVEDVQTVALCLKDGLADMVRAFGKYAKELGLKEGEMAVVRNIAGLGEEMQMLN